MPIVEFSGIGAWGWRDTKSFCYYMVAGRPFMVFATLLIMSVNGSGYMFGLYSNDIKSSLGYDQTTLNLLSFFKDLGGNLGVIAGLIYEVTPPWVVLSIGGLMNFFGYFMIWLSVTGRIAKPHVWQMCLYIWIGANSQSYPNTGALVTCVKNFPESRGSVIGLLKGFIGLSGAIITQLYHAFYGDDTKSLILLIAWLPTIVPLLFLPSIRIMKAVQLEKELKIFYNFLYPSVCLAGFMMVIIIIQNKLTFTRSEYIASASIVVLILLVPLAIVINQEFEIWKTKTVALNNQPQTSIETENPTPSSEASQEAKKLCKFSCLENIFNLPNRGEDYTILQAIFSIDMLILFIATTCGIGGTLTAIDNLGQIGKSLGYPKHSIATFISLVSIWNFLGRVLAGFASEIALTKYNFPRPLMLTFVILFSCIGHLLIAFGVPNSLYFASVMIGFCLGAQLPLLCAIISEIFGLKHYSTLYNVGSISSPVGSYILNVKVAGPLYDKEGLKQMRDLGITRKAGEDLDCKGGDCFRMAFIVITVATLFGCVVSLVLVMRTSKFYKGDIYKKFREEARDAVQRDISLTGNVERLTELEGGANTSSHGERLKY